MPIDLKYNTVADSDTRSHVELVVNPLTSSTTNLNEENGVQMESILTSHGRTATVMSSYINLVSTCVGAGIIGVPYAFSKAGWVLGTILLFLGAAFSFIGSNLLAECALRLKGPATFYSVAEVTIPKYAFIVDILVAIKCTGVTTSYLFIVGDSLPPVMQDLNAPLFLQDRMVCILLCCFFVCIPISLFPKLDHLRFSSFLSAFMLIYLVLLVALYSMHVPSNLLDPCLNYETSNSPSTNMNLPVSSDGYLCASISTTDAILHNHSSGEPNTPFNQCRGPQSLFLTSFETLSVLSIFAFNYSCQQNVFTVTNEIQNPTLSRLNTVFALTFGTALLMYIVITYTAYSTFGANITPDIIAMYPGTKLTSVCRIMISLILSMHYPLQLNPARKSVLSLTRYFGRYREDELSESTSKRIYYGVTVCIFTLNLTFAFFFTDLGVTYQVCGATGSTLVIFVLPGLFYYIIHSGSSTATLTTDCDKPVAASDDGDSVGGFSIVSLDDEETESGDVPNVIHFNQSGASQHGLISAMEASGTSSSSTRNSTSSDASKGKKIIGPKWKLYLSVLMLVIGVILMPLSTVLILLQIQHQH